MRAIDGNTLEGDPWAVTLLPSEEGVVELAQSALDRSWMERVDDTHGAFITAGGVLMYLDPEDALGLIRDCAARFPGGQMMFDSFPGVRVARDIALPPGRGVWRAQAWAPLDGIGPLRRTRPSITILEFA